jgi:hypothetical protein
MSSIHVLLTVFGQCGERLTERGSSLCFPIRLDDEHVRPDQLHQVGGSVVVDVQFEFHATRSQERKIGKCVREVVGGYFQQPEPWASRGLIADDGVHQSHVALSIRDWWSRRTRCTDLALLRYEVGITVSGSSTP